VDTLREEGIEPTMYWFNPNIHPFKEYAARRDCFKDYCEQQKLKYIIEDNYGLDEFCKNVANDINARCVNYCYPIRMRRLFELAKENGYDTVSTTLLYSIYQKHDYIKKLCKDL
jgi:predicted adenine nucleotide alpha hydrolase (AANH) superfamily ATPase